MFNNQTFINKNNVTVIAFYTALVALAGCGGGGGWGTQTSMTVSDTSTAETNTSGATSTAGSTSSDTTSIANTTATTAPTFVGSFVPVAVVDTQTMEVSLTAAHPSYPDTEFQWGGAPIKAKDETVNYSASVALQA